MKLRNNQAGISKLVLGVVGGVTFVVLVFVLPAALHGPGKANDLKRHADIKTINTALAAYYKDNSSYPSAGGDSCRTNQPTCLQAALAGGASPYIPKIPNSPNGGGYLYEPSPSGCATGACVGYTLSATLENGSVYSVTDTTVIK